MDRDSAIVKIKKCLALAKSANEAEAATALRQAQTLMREHGLDEEGVDLASVAEMDVKARFIPLLVWEAELVGMVADAFGCHVISTYKTDWSHLHARRGRFWKLIGVNAAPEIAGYTFEVLAGQAVRARLAHMGKQPKNCKPVTKVARGDAFAFGWVCAVRALIEQFANSERNDALVDAYVRKSFPNLLQARLKRRDVGRNVKDDAADGRRAAASASLHHGVGSPLERKLISR